MDPQQSSATAAVDPDRVSIQYFEKGGANPQRDPVVIVILDPEKYFSLNCCILFLGSH